MGLRNFVRSLRPGNDQQLAADLSGQRRQGHRRSLLGTARAGQAWEDQDRKQERQRRGPYAQ
jgi:hypothetical protein